MVSRHLLVSAVLLLVISNSSAQDSVFYPAKAIAEGESTCPSGEDREALLSVMDTEIDNLLKSVVDTVSPCSEAFRGMTEHCPARSCNEIFSKSREARPSGLYWLSAQNETVVHAYCYMNMECCGTVGGWYRIAWLNLNDAFHSCPYGWRNISNPIRSCGRTYSNYETVTFASRGLNYSRVCGTIIGYQQGTPDAFSYSDSHIATVNINQNYVDGVSVTYRPSLNRMHIWTFAAGLADSIAYHGSRSCPCSNTGNSYETNIPAFVGNDYFCEGGNDSDDLWDGQTCIRSSTCCSFNQPPKFCRELPEPTCADIEVRLMADEPTSNEDVPIKLIELYVQ